MHVATEMKWSIISGNNDKDTKTATEKEASTKQNMESQSKGGKAGGLYCALNLGYFVSNTDGTTTFIDATTACNNCDNNSKVYFRSAISNMLSNYENCDSNGRLHMCINFA